LPFFIPLQDFPKAFDYENLILKTFTRYGLSGVHYDAFQYLARNGKIVFLLDSFDEMAQKLTRTVIRDNIRELLVGLSGGSKVIMTSRPNYFEGKSERLLVLETIATRLDNTMDMEYLSSQAVVTRDIETRLATTRFARLRDLTPAQCQALFSSVLAENPLARKKLIELFQRFQQLENLSQRAVIARLLITVAETLAQTTQGLGDAESQIVLPETDSLNEGTIFQIVVQNLLRRDQLSDLLPSQRLKFLRNFAVFLQRPIGSFFAAPAELRAVVEYTFTEELNRVDAREQTLEEYYRSCRRHAGLTTLQQFNDTSGRIDLPVDDTDLDAPICFSHNSLREFLVADAITARVCADGGRFTDTVSLTPAIVGFVWDLAANDPTIVSMLTKGYSESEHTDENAFLFSILLESIKRDKQDGARVFGTPPKMAGLLLSDVDLSGVNFEGAVFEDCILENVNLKASNLRRSTVTNCILLNVSFDEAVLDRTDFRHTEIQSIYVNDIFGRNTIAILTGREARQWLFSHGALVHPSDDLNVYLGRNWYESAKEVAATLSRRIAGTYKQTSLAKGTRLSDREIAVNFVEYLVRKDILEVRIRDSKGNIVALRPEFRAIITNFAKNGVIAPILDDFFRPYLAKSVAAVPQTGDRRWTT
jgi:Pentapeptide repeats (9 copies)